MDDKTLISYAITAKIKAYAPYSKFSVGAALLCGSGRHYLGCNVENICTPAGICAERVAITKAISEGERIFERIAVVSDSDEFCVPCGLCRQVLYEFNPDMVVLCAKSDGSFLSYSLKTLLPHAFSKESFELG